MPAHSIAARSIRATLSLLLLLAGLLVVPASQAGAVEVLDVEFDSTSSTVRVTWRTADPSRSTLLWGTDPTYGNASVGREAKVEHSVDLSDLDCATTYHFAMVSVGPDGVATNSIGHKHTTPACSADPVTDPGTGPDDGGDPPMIPTVQVDNSRAVIVWRSTAPGFGTVAFGTEIPYDSAEPETGELATEVHRVELADLACETTYHFTAIVRLEDGTFEASDDHIFTTGSCPSIFDEIQSVAGQTTATVTWSTAVAANSSLRFRVLDGSDSEWSEVASGVTDTAHRADLAGLVCSTTYEFVIVADPAGGDGDGDGVASTQAAVESGRFSTADCDQQDPIPGLPGQGDQTPDTAPVVSELDFAIGETSLSATWTTDLIADAELRWSLDATTWESDSSQTVGTDHRVDVFGLECESTYTVEAVSTSSSGLTGTSERLTLSTRECGSGVEIDPPASTDPVDPVDPEEPLTPALRIIHQEVADISKTSATVIWVTDRAGSGLVRFDAVRNAADGLDLEASSPVPGVSQRVALSDLLCGTAYRVAPVAVTESGQMTEGASIEFETVACGGTVLSGVDVRPTDRAIVVKWTTDVVADSMVIFGPGRTYGTAVYSPTRVLQHQIVLNELECDATVHLRVISNAGFGPATFSSDIETRTLPCPDPNEPGPDDPGPTDPDPTDPGPDDPTDPGPDDPDPTDPGPDDPNPVDPGPDDPGSSDPLALTDISVDAGVDTAEISWITDKPSTATVSYGLSSAYGLTVDVDTARTQQSVSIEGLTCATTYHAQVVVVAAAADGTRAASQDIEFTTSDCVSDRLEIVAVNAVADDETATVLVTTSVEASVIVRWGEGDRLDRSATGASPAKVQELTLADLECGTTYSYQVEASTDDGFANTRRMELTTADCIADRL